MTRVPSMLQTERLNLRACRVDEAAVFRRLWEERDPRVPPRRRVDADGRPSIEDVAEAIRAEQDSSTPGVLAVEVKESGDVIGYCGLVFHGNGAPDDPELAFELLRSAHGRGYATEAGHAVLDWAGTVGYQRVWATVWDWNTASRRVLGKLGFRDTGRREEGAHGVSLLTVRELGSRGPD